MKFANAALFLRLGLLSTLIRRENGGLFLRFGLPSTLIRHENGALFLRFGLPSTLIRHAEDGALFLRLGLPSTLIRRHENGAFRKRATNRKNLKSLALGFSVCGKHFENGNFRKHRGKDNHVISPPSFPQTQIQIDR